MIRRRSAGGVPECHISYMQDHVTSVNSNFASKSEINMHERNRSKVSFTKIHKNSIFLEVRVNVTFTFLSPDPLILPLLD